jgi:aerobic carbon-monoxide dehydrogenase medium subunit
VIPAPFRYLRADSAAHAVTLLGEHGDEAKLLAGGQSLLPILKVRLAQPEVLIDISRIAELSYIRVEDGEVAIGAGTRHRDVVESADLRREVPLLPTVAGYVGDRQIRHRGTIGGSLVHADPAADLPCAALALGATFVVQGPTGQRRIEAEEFFQGYFQTAVGEDEMLVEVRVPRTGGAGWGYEKFVRRANDWAIVAVATVDGRVAMANMGETPLRATAVEQALASGASPADAAASAAEGTSPIEDMHADRDYRRHLARVLTERALTTAASPA